MVFIFIAGWSSLAARVAHNHEVAGSNPAPATIKCWMNDIERERGRENGSFPEVEVLKPQGFKESRKSGTSEIPAPATIFEEAL